MLKPGWQKQFGILAESSISLLSEQADVAYKQGSVTRLKACVSFLLEHDACADEHLIHLAEAGLKTNRPYMAAFALQKLVELHPNQADYLLHLAQVQTQLHAFTQAQQTLQAIPSQLHSTAEFIQQKQLIDNKQAQQQEIGRTLAQVLTGKVADKLSLAEFEQQAQAVLQAAVNLGDAQLITDVCVALAKRLDVPQDLLIQLYQSIPQNENKQQIGAFVYALAKVGCYPQLIRFYLNDMLEQRQEIANPKPLLLSLKAVKQQSEYADVVALLSALIGEWQSFAALCEKAMAVPAKPAALFQYAASFWLQRQQSEMLTLWLSRASQLSAQQLCFFAAALEHDHQYLSARLELLQLALAKDASNPYVLNDVGDALLKTGNRPDAIQFFFKAVNNEQEENFYTCYNLAITLQGEGDNKQAFDYFKRAIAVDPSQWPTWKQLCLLMISSGAWQMAHGMAQFYLSANADDAQVWGALATASLKMSRITNARTYIEQALKIKPKAAGPLATLSLIEMACGNITEAFDANQQVLKDHNAAETVRRNSLSNMLFCGNYDPARSADQLLNIYQQVADYMPRQKYFPEVADYSGRRIRVGYVSADLKLHPVAFFVEALFKHHDRSCFEIFAYSGVGLEDKYSDLFKTCVDHWRYVGKTLDADLAEMIIEDGIDVLVDLSGHTDGNRLGVFALKPCAVQISWLGFAHSTGMPQMDYFLGDPQLTPESCDPYFSEQPYRLPRASYCFTPNMNFRDFQPVIVKKSPQQPLVLGNLGRAIRFNTPVLNLWKQVLDAVPNSIIKIDNPNFADEESQQMMRQRFAEHGIGEDRLWVGFTPDYWQSIVDIDIALDGFPQNSGTTLFEFLWCGTPVVSLKDRPSVGRLGAMVLHGVGRDEWIADTPQQYVDIIAKLAADRDALHQLRLGLRQEFLQSELCDGADFASAVENAYLAMLKEKSQCQ